MFDVMLLKILNVLLSMSIKTTAKFGPDAIIFQAVFCSYNYINMYLNYIFSTILNDIGTLRSTTWQARRPSKQKIRLEQNKENE